MGDTQKLSAAEQIRAAREQFEEAPDLSVAVVGGAPDGQS